MSSAAGLSASSATLPSGGSLMWRSCSRTAVSRLRAAVDAARAELREFARGCIPRCWLSAGCRASVGGFELAGRSPVTGRGCRAPRAFPPATQAAAYFVCAESLTNVAKHAWASVASASGLRVSSRAADRRRCNRRRRSRPFAQLPVARSGRPYRGARRLTGGGRPARRRYPRNGDPVVRLIDRLAPGIDGAGLAVCQLSLAGRPR